MGHEMNKVGDRAKKIIELDRVRRERRTKVEKIYITPYQITMLSELIAAELEKRNRGRFNG